MAYNLVLAAVAVGWLVLTWPHFREALTLQSFVALLILAACANACYSLAYFADIAIQRSPFRLAWQPQRRSLWLAGVICAVVVENYWIADEIYPYVR